MMMRQMVTYIAAPLTYQAFPSANPAFGEASENSDPGKLIGLSITSIQTEMKMLRQKEEGREFHEISRVILKKAGYVFEERSA